MCVCSAIPVSGAAFDLLGISYLPVRRDDSKYFVRRDRRTLRHVIDREYFRACVSVGH